MWGKGWRPVKSVFGEVLKKGSEFKFEEFKFLFVLFEIWMLNFDKVQFKFNKYINLPRAAAKIWHVLNRNVKS